MTPPPTKWPYHERVLPPHDHKETATKRRFTPKPFTTIPSKLFPNDICPPSLARFISTEDRREALIFVAGRGAGTEAAPDRSVYAYVWGRPIPDDPIPHHAIHNLDTNDHPHTTERAQLQAIITALQSWRVWKLERRNHVVVAYSGDYILDHVARVDLREQVDEGKGKVAEKEWRSADNLDLKGTLVDVLEKMDDERVLVMFWQVDGKYNEAEELFRVRRVPGAFVESE